MKRKTCVQVLISLLMQTISMHTIQLARTLNHCRQCLGWSFHNSIHRSFVPQPVSQPNRRLIKRYATYDKGNMENLYQEWTLAQDKLLWENRKEPISSLAVLLGRGLRGTEQRIAKLKDVDSFAFQRLFVNGSIVKPLSDQEIPQTKSKLVPSSEVIRRIQWDDALPTQDFFIVYYDRMDDTLVETNICAPNLSISGKESKFIDALPEHRIFAIKYKERIVWDREKRLDLFFDGEGIMCVIQNYERWKKEKDDEEEYNRQRRLYTLDKLRRILGNDRSELLNDLWTKFVARASNDPTLSMKVESEKFVRSALDLFKQVWRDTEISLMPQLIPSSDVETLELLSEFIVICPDATISPHVINEISLGMMRAEGKLRPTPRGQLPEIDENDLIETFIRGTGPGGQKINKTSNRVCLVHEPTQLRVECQETRSLPQNRKIARKRLREKLDEYLNGNQSKANIAAQKASTKKAKTKARSKARLRDKQTSDESDDI